MRKPVFRVLPPRPQTVGVAHWRLWWTAATLLCLVVLSLVNAGDHKTAHLLVAEINSAQASEFNNIGPAERPRPRLAVSEQVYDHFLQDFTALRGNSKRRQYLVRQILAAASEHRVDPDLLFALIAVESGFNSAAISPKGARGLGQIMPTTARAIAPNVIRRPEDLYNVQRNLRVTALEVRRLLDKRAGDVWAALSEYTYGVADRHVVQHSRSPYVAHICMYYALLKTKREYDEFIAKGEGGPEPVAG
jgi:hypothetical protein